MDTRDADEQPARSPFHKRDQRQRPYRRQQTACLLWPRRKQREFRDRKSATGRSEWDRLSGLVVVGQPTQGVAVVVIFQPMPGILGALVAFMREYQRCGELEGGRDDEYVWLACSCGAHIAHRPTSQPAGPRW